MFARNIHQRSAVSGLRFGFLLGLGFLISASGSGCVSARSRQIDLLKDRAVKLKPLSTYKPTVCSVSVELTSPALARYKEMFPKEKIGEMQFTWRARESSCEILASQKTAVTDNYKGFLDEALCVMMQTHWVNSPFDEFPFAEDRLSETDDEVLLAAGKGTESGLVLSKKDFVITTRTKARGNYIARYAEAGGQWLPAKIEKVSAQGLRIVVDEFAWSDDRVNGRRMPSSLTIYAGDVEPHRHSTLSIRDCHAD